MSYLNVDIPRFYCFLREEFLYNLKSHLGGGIPCCVFGISSIPGRALGFHVLLENGAVIWRLPIHSLMHKECNINWSIDVHQLWDCMSDRVAVTQFDRLKDLCCDVYLKNKDIHRGRYMFTVDWWGSATSEDVDDGGHKCAHIIALENGLYVAQPNNRIRWLDSAFVTPFSKKPDYETINQIWICENGHKWTSEESNKMFYELKVKAEINA